MTDGAAITVGIVLVLTLAWLGLQIRALHEDLLPVIALSESPVLQGAARIGR